MTTASTIFREILAGNPENSCAIFDLDSTLFNVHSRTLQIMKDLLRDKAVCAQFPNEIEVLRKIQILDSDWGVIQPLARLGFPEGTPFFKAARKHWKQHFFTNNYLKHDKPYPGAVEFVNTLKDKGVKIFYLTGRDEKNMHRGTVESLRDWKFPLAQESDLHMKPVKGDSLDEVFKSERLRTMKLPDHKIWFFENEPVIIRRVQAEHPEVNLIFVDTIHSGRASSPTHLQSISGDFTFQI